MTATELAALLDGREYPLEMNDLSETARDSGLMVIYGDSDDLIELDGFVRDEVDCWEGGTFRVDRSGFLPDFDQISHDEEEIKSWQSRKEGAREITAIWGRNDISWQYKTSIPHVTFRIMEDGDVYCRGIVFSLDGLVQEATP